MSKKIIFITLLFCGLAFSAQSQSLTYSKVILLTSLDTVPQGKVWKVTSFLPDNSWVSVSYPTSNGALDVLINGAVAKISYYSHDASAGGGSLQEKVPFPIWLPAGTTLEPSTNCGSLSIIEFTENNE